MDVSLPSFVCLPCLSLGCCVCFGFEVLVFVVTFVSLIRALSLTIFCLSSGLVSGNIIYLVALCISK